MERPTGGTNSLEVRQERAKQDIEAVVRNFRQDDTTWKELRDQLQNAQTDDDRVKILVDFATSEGALSRLRPDVVQGEELAATPTVTTVTVTTVTTV
ncbi:hypothetical protein [Blastococcus sp. SYSU DS0541]